jgi:molybdate transport system ATP-binding protein
VKVQLARIQLERAGRTVLRDIDWTIRPGERWILAGGNGAGKTQLLKLVAGAVWPTPTGRELLRYEWRNEVWCTPLEVKDEIAYVGAERQDKYERYGWNHTVRQIVGTGLYRTDIPLDPLSAADHKQIGRLLARLAIEHLAERRFLSLSYGERRLVLLARALASRPKLLLLDELLNGLDSRNRENALRWLERTSRSRLPWVLSTHRADDVPDSATHALVLENGRIVYRGSIARAPLQRWLDADHTAVVSIPPRPRRARSTRPLVRLSNAHVWLDGHEILKGVSLEVRPGECWVVHGANGSGKTTLLRTLYGDHSVASGGRIERAGIAPGVPLENFKRRVGLVAPHLQADHPLEMTVAEVVQSGRYASIGLNDAPRKADREAARRALEFFGIAALESRTLRELSYGQMRRVLFARAWVNRPKLLLLDEPLAGVDAHTTQALLKNINEVLARGTAIVMSTHRRREWPAGVTHELQLNKGRVVYSGAVREQAYSGEIAS